MAQTRFMEINAVRFMRPSPSAQKQLREWLRRHELNPDQVESVRLEGDAAFRVVMFLLDAQGKRYAVWDDGKPIEREPFEKSIRPGHKAVVASETSDVRTREPVPPAVRRELDAL